MKLINRLSILAMYEEQLAKSDDPIQRRDALLHLANFISVKEDDDDDDDDDDDNDDDGFDYELIDMVGKSLLGDPDPNVRRFAAYVLRNYQIPRVQKMLVEALKDSDPAVRFEVVEALASLEIYNEEYDLAEALLTAMGDECREVGMRAAFHLSHFDYSDVRMVIFKLYPDWLV